MKARTIVGLLLAATVIAGGVWAIVNWRNQPPDVPFAKVLREPIASSVPTNGKVEPIEWAEARAESAGSVKNIFVQRGGHVAQGAALAELDSSEARAELTAAQARLSQVHAEIDVLEKGGRATDLTSIAGELERERLEAASAQREYDTLARLQSKQAATTLEVSVAKDRLERAQAQIRALEQRRGALTTTVDRSAADARLRDAESAVALAQERIRKSTILAPISGTVYQFDLKTGAHLNAGDLVASIGQLDRVRVKVYVDEPDLGRVAQGKPVNITWDAKPGAQWKGQVDRTPTQIVPMGSRQVGEVLCVIENPQGELLPGTNVNAAILADAVASALTIPKEAVQRKKDQAGVYTLADGANGARLVVWKNVTLGVSNTTRTQVEGLKEGDAVMLPSDRTIKDGLAVNPAMQ